MKETLCIFAVAFILAGCASTSNPVPFGKDTYMISASTNHPGFMDAKMTENIMTKANLHCESMNKVMVPKNTNQAGSAWQSSVQFIYSCVDNNDPENQRPVWGKAADTNVIIEKQLK